MHKKQLFIIFLSVLMTGLTACSEPKEFVGLSNNAVLTDNPGSMGDLIKRKYITDCTFVEPYQYPDVYDVPFMKAKEYYVKNKDLDDAVKEPVIETAKAFFDAMLDTGYRDIQTDPVAYADKIRAYSANTILLNGIYPFADNEYYAVEDIAETLGDYLIENRVEQEDTFVTNTSLVYGDFGGYYVRGVLENTTHASDDEEVEKETMHIRYYDVYVVKNNASPTGYSVMELSNIS